MVSPTVCFRTGALHVGDRILAINGQSLNGKRVSEAMQMLQGSGDIVNLKIARCVDPPYPYQNSSGNRRHYNSTGFGPAGMDHYDRVSIIKIILYIRVRILYITVMWDF